MKLSLAEDRTSVVHWTGGLIQKQRLFFQPYFLFHSHSAVCVFSTPFRNQNFLMPLFPACTPAMWTGLLSAAFIQW